jgi:hypothetical protein
LEAGELMLQGVCVDSGQSAVLQKGTSYYLFPNGVNHFYVSLFPNPNAHKGCFQKAYFQIIEKELWPEEPEVIPVGLDPEQIYKAQLTWRKPGYKSVELKDYYIRPKKTHCYLYQDSRLEDCRGCFPLHWFTNFEPYFHEIVLENIDFVIETDEIEPIMAENVPIFNKYEQLSLFEF